MNEKIDVLEALAGWCNEKGIGAIEYARRSAVYGAVDELIEAAVKVHAACRAGIEPDLIALADALDSVGSKDVRKAALARIGNDA